MEVKLTSELQARLDRMVALTGRTQNDFLQDAVASYLEELDQLRRTLNDRYDDLKSGKVKPVPGDQVIARLRHMGVEQRPHIR